METRQFPSAGDAVRARLEQAVLAAESEAHAAIAAEFDAVHTVERALAVGSLAGIVEPARAPS